MARSMRTAKDHGYVCAVLDRAATTLWRFAARIEAADGRRAGGVTPQEWRIAADLKGNAPKDACAERAAELAGEPLLAHKQDAADAYLIARAGYQLMHPNRRQRESRRRRLPHREGPVPQQP